MSNTGTCVRVVSLAVIILLASLSNVQSQDLFREMDQVKKDISDLRNELRDVRDVVYSLRKMLLQSVTIAPEQPPEKAPPKEAKAPKQEITISDEELTRIICRAVGKFFSEAEASLALRDGSAAQKRMTNALQNLNSVLREYAGTHRVNKLLNIYEGLAWDTYVAVQLRESIRGNEEFIKVLQKHKQRYIETCPKD